MGEHGFLCVCAAAKVSHSISWFFTSFFFLLYVSVFFLLLPKGLSEVWVFLCLKRFTNTCLHVSLIKCEFLLSWTMRTQKIKNCCAGRVFVIFPMIKSLEIGLLSLFTPSTTQMWLNFWDRSSRVGPEADALFSIPTTIWNATCCILTEL